MPEWYAKIWRQSFLGRKRSKYRGSEACIFMKRTRVSVDWTGRWRERAVWNKIEEVDRSQFIQGFRTLTKSLDIILRVMGSTSHPVAVLPSMPLKCVQNMTTAHHYTNTFTYFNQENGRIKSKWKNKQNSAVYRMVQNGLWRGNYFMVQMGDNIGLD